MLVENLEKLTSRIEKARQRSPLAQPRISLVAAAKSQPPERLLEAIRAGVAAFGENRVQEAARKWPPLLAAHPQVKLHLIGPLQTNKAGEAVALFHVIETLDRPKLAEALARELEKSRTRELDKESNFRVLESSSPRFFIQVNTGEEPQKAGVAPQAADDFIRYCRGTLKLPVTGLMCVPPADAPAAPHFALLRRIARRHGLQELSMGMSGDFETAVQLGATEVRIGTALFGPRP